MIDAAAKALARWAVPYNDWDGLTEEQRERWRAGARAVIGAIRNPSASMLNVYSDAVANGLSDERCWWEMIDAALTPADG